MVGESRIEDDVPVKMPPQGEQPADVLAVPFRTAAGEIFQAAVFRIGGFHVRGELQCPSFLLRGSDTGIRVEKVERVPVCSRLFPAGEVGEPVQPRGRGIHAVLPDGTGFQMNGEIVAQQEFVEAVNPFPSDIAAAEHQHAFWGLDDAQGQFVPGDIFVPCGQLVLPSAELRETVDLSGIEAENAAGSTGSPSERMKTMSRRLTLTTGFSPFSLIWGSSPPVIYSLTGVPRKKGGRADMRGKR